MSEPATNSQLTAVHLAITIMLVVFLSITLASIVPRLIKIEQMQPCSMNK